MDLVSCYKSFQYWQDNDVSRKTRPFTFNNVK